MKRTHEASPSRKTEAAVKTDLAPANFPSFLDDLRAVIRPKERWYYVYHAIVVLVALWYWIASRILLPHASWAEIAMYRPEGDNQVWPVIAALSRLNFGDPTDAFHYGQGIGGFHAVILLPHAIAYALFGAAGYMVADVVISFCYFTAAAMLFRRWGLSVFSSLALSSVLATQALQSLLQKFSYALSKLVALTGEQMAEWDFPDLVPLNISSKRIPRPFPTEVFLVLALYFLLRTWQERRPLSWKRGLALGVIMGLLAQGDPYSFVALGLVSLVVLVRNMSFQNWKLPWRFLLGSIAGAATVGWYFVVQLACQNPESAVRFGLAPFSRSQLHVLAGYAPWVRLFVIAALAFAVWKFSRNRAHGSANNRSLPFFALTLVVGGFLAQPIQLMLLGKGAQIYHYMLFTLPTLYAYALILLLIRLCLVLKETGDAPLRQHFTARFVRNASLVVLAVVFVLGTEQANDVIKYSGASRRESSPWVYLGDAFRPSLRGLDRQFRENSLLKNTRTFVSLCQEVNFLLTAFHDKRAWLPDNGFTTLNDRELEQRLFQSSMLCGIHPRAFAFMIQDRYTMNYWLGCAKYWFTREHQFAPLSDYAPGVVESMLRDTKGSGFRLALPLSELRRLTQEYETFYGNSAKTMTNFPDTLIISSIVTEQGFQADPSLYRKIYTNTVFTVYVHNSRQ